MVSSSKFRKFVVLLAVLVVAMSASSVGQASPPQAAGTVKINAWNSDPVVVGAGQKAKIRIVWYACSKGLVTDFVKSARGTYVLKKSNGTIIETHKTKPSKWGGYEAVSDTSKCVWPTSSGWGKAYKSSALTLAKPGTYYLEVLIWLKEPVIDGWDSGSDWPIDYFSGKLESHTITITKN